MKKLNIDEMKKVNGGFIPNLDFIDAAVFCMDWCYGYNTPDPDKCAINCMEKQGY